MPNESPISQPNPDDDRAFGGDKGSSGPSSKGQVQPTLGSLTLFAAGLLVVVSLAFASLPVLDIWSSGLFYEEGLGFWMTSFEWLKTWFWIVDVVGRAVVIGCLIWLVVTLIRRQPATLAVCVTLSILLGPMLTVNAVLKDNWGRARPAQTALFGGEKKFTPAWARSSECQRNCSFTSGHAAAGFAPLVMYPITRRRRWLWGGVGLGLATGLSRMVVGAHFLSDVLISGLIVFLVASMVTLSVQRGRKATENHPPQ